MKNKKKYFKVNLQTKNFPIGAGLFDEKKPSDIFFSQLRANLIYLGLPK